MGNSQGIGIGIGIGIIIGIGIGVIVLPIVADSLSNQPNPVADIIANPIADIIETDDARLASLSAYYYEERDRLLTVLTLMDSNGDDTKANGHLELRILNEDDVVVYFKEYDFKKDDFISWKNNFGNKITGYRMDITNFFPDGKYQVYADFNTQKSTWKDLNTSFYSLED